MAEHCTVGRFQWQRLAAAWLVAWVAGCGKPAATTPPQPPNVIVILADTLRADRVGRSEGGVKLTPFLDSLAAKGTVYARAYAASSWTQPSVASLFTSRYPTQHGQTSFATTLPPDDVTLAEVLAAHGYATTAVSAQPALSPALGLSRGFDTVRIVTNASHATGTARDVNNVALAELDARAAPDRARPQFLYVHYMDSHVPYRPSTESLERVLKRRPDVPAARALAQRASARVDQILARMHDPSFVEHIRSATAALSDVAPGLDDLYDAEAVYLDMRTRELLDGLEKRGLLRNSIVIFTADHGQEFFEHGNFGHGFSLYEEVLRVPLVISDTAQQGPATVTTATSLVDVAPTILERAGVPPPKSFMGRPLTRTRPGQLAARLGLASESPVFAELYPYGTGPETTEPTRTVVHGTWKLIVPPAGAPPMLFQLAVDAGEDRPVDDPAVSTPMRQSLAGFVAGLRQQVSSAGSVELDDATRQRLRALGYAE